AACTMNTSTAPTFTIGGNTYYKQACSFYGGDWAGILGTATINFGASGGAVGLFDTYDFDIRIRKKADGTNDYKNSVGTAMAHLLPSVTLTPQTFRLLYGVFDPSSP
ncbi:MAG: hypothetical protein ABI852_15690, partial [Gemmatimonadaceae bacterium]